METIGCTLTKTQKNKIELEIFEEKNPDFNQLEVRYIEPFLQNEAISH